mgnify:CR=1 FL=1
MNSNELSKIKWLVVGSIVLQAVLSFITIAWITFMSVD